MCYMTHAGPQWQEQVKWELSPTSSTLSLWVPPEGQQERIKQWELPSIYRHWSPLVSWPRHKVRWNAARGWILDGQHPICSLLDISNSFAARVLNSQLMGYLVAKCNFKAVFPSKVREVDALSGSVGNRSIFFFFFFAPSRQSIVIASFGKLSLF